MRVIPPLLLCLVLGLPLPLLAQASPDQMAIRQLLNDIFEKPDSPLSLEPVVIDDDAAIVGWIQGDLAGRAFLRNASGRWTIVACGGDALKAAATLQRLGLPQGRRSGSRLRWQQPRRGSTLGV